MHDLQLEIIDPLRRPGWDDLLLGQPEYTFFHSSPWARVLSESYRYRPFYFARIESGKISVLVPVMEVSSVLTGRRGVSLPFTDYCEPVFDKESYPALIAFLGKFGKEAGWDSWEIRPGNGGFPDAPSSASYLVHTLDLSPGEDGLFKKFRNTTQRNIKKAVREGVTIRLHTSADSVAAFYRLNCLTRKEHGLPPQPRAFFANLHEHVIGPGLGFVALASYQGREIAGAVYLSSREKTIYKYGASLKSYQHLRANNLVMWEAIRASVEKGQKSFCFGRTEPDHTGLRQFKAGWGGEEKVIDYFKYDINKGEFVKGNGPGTAWSAAVWRHTPIPLLKLAGRVLYRHVG